MILSLIVKNDRLNWSTMLIDCFASIGWAYDLKTIPWNIVKERVKRTGDGSHGIYGTGENVEDVDKESSV